MGDQAITFTEVWNAAKDVATIMVNGESQSMPPRAFAVPAGHQPGELDWAEEVSDGKLYTALWGSKATEWGVSSGTQLRLGVDWKWGGRLNGAGRFLHEARLWAILDHSGLGQNFNITGSFGDAYLRGQTGVLSAVIRVEMKFMKLHWTDMEFDVEVTGAGGGFIRAK